MAQVGGTVAQNYGTEVISALEINDPQISNHLFRPYMSEMKEYFLLRSLGYESSVSASTWSHFEADKTTQAFKVQAHAVGSGANVAVELSLHADSIDSNGKFYPRVTDVVTFKGAISTAVQASIIAVNTSTGTITVKPIKSTDIIPAVLAAETVIITSGVSGEGSGLPKSAFKKVKKYTHQAQILKEAIGASGSALTTSSYITMLNQAGEAQGLYSEAMVDVEYRLMNKVEGALMVGKKNTAATANVDPNNDGEYLGKLLTSTSLLEAATTRGVQATPYGSWTTPLTSFDALTASLVKQYVPAGTKIWGSLGLAAYSELTNALYTLFETSTDSYVDKMKTDMGISQIAGLDFNGFHKTYNYMFDTNMYLSDPEGGGATGYAYDQYGVLIPLRTMKDNMSVGSTARKIPNFGIRHKAMGAYNRKFKIGKLSGVGSTGANEVPVHEYDYTRYGILTEVGAEFMNANSLVFMSKS